MLILASASPRRSELLGQLGFELGVGFEIQPVDIDESPLAGELPEDYVVRVASKKASESLRAQAESNTVLAADTTVTIDQEILGKPQDFDDFKRMMLLLSGREHQVLTAVSVINRSKREQFLSVSEVRFSSMTEDSIQAYWKTGEPKDKAGGYGIQGLGARYIVSIKGSYTGIVGLPLYETSELLEEFGI